MGSQRLRNTLGLEHLVRVWPHPGEFPLADRFADAAVNAERPAALLWIFDLDRHATDAFDFDRRGFTVLHRAQPLMIGAAGEYVAHLKRGDARGPCHNLTNRMLHIVGVVILTEFLVFPKLP